MQTDLISMFGCKVSWQFTVGINLKGSPTGLVVSAEDITPPGGAFFMKPLVRELAAALSKDGNAGAA